MNACLKGMAYRAPLLVHDIPLLHERDHLVLVLIEPAQHWLFDRVELRVLLEELHELGHLGLPRRGLLDGLHPGQPHRGYVDLDHPETKTQYFRSGLSVGSFCWPPTHPTRSKGSPGAVRRVYERLRARKYCPCVAPTLSCHLLGTKMHNSRYRSRFNCC